MQLLVSGFWPCQVRPFWPVAPLNAHFKSSSLYSSHFPSPRNCFCIFHYRAMVVPFLRIVWMKSWEHVAQIWQLTNMGSRKLSLKSLIWILKEECLVAPKHFEKASSDQIWEGSWEAISEIWYLDLIDDSVFLLLFSPPSFLLITSLIFDNLIFCRLNFSSHQGGTNCG